MKKTIKIKFVDFNIGMKFTKESNDFVDALSKRYNVVQCDDPDYVFYSVFGAEHLKYDCVRIFYTGECYTPDFNECDYAIGFDRLQFGDRYLRVPLYRLLKYKESYAELFDRKHFTMEDVRKKKKFCNFVYSNCFTKSVRAEFFDKLNAYKRVESGGRYKNNVGGAVADKRAFQEETKFTIAFENTVYDGYCTEKLIEALAAGTVPIYYGDPRVAEDFNPDSFINVTDFATLDDVVERVIQIDNNDELYLRMLNAATVLNPTDLSDFEQFLFHIFDQDLSQAKRRPCSQTSISMERFKLRHQFFEKHFYKYYSKLKNTVVRLKTGTLLFGGK